MSELPINQILCGDAVELSREKLPDGSIDAIITDPPYYTKQYLTKGKWGKQVKELAGIKNIASFKANWDVFEDEKEYQLFSDDWIKGAYRVLKPKGNMMINCLLTGEMAGYYNILTSLKKFDFALMNDISWCKPNGQPNLAGVRFSFSTEHIIWVCKKAKKGKRTFNYQALKRLNKGKQMRDYWIIPTEPTKFKHPSVKPIRLLKIMVTAISNENDIILDPFIGSGTTAVACRLLNRHYIGFDNNPEYIEIAKHRLAAIPKPLEAYGL